jgi:hypothetical protein
MLMKLTPGEACVFGTLRVFMIDNCTYLAKSSSPDDPCNVHTRGEATKI